MPQEVPRIDGTFRVISSRLLRLIKEWPRAVDIRTVV
jgi:hypothetical protein